MQDVMEFWRALSGRISALIDSRTADCLRGRLYDVVSSPADGKIGVRLPYGSTVLQLPCSRAVESAVPGDTVLVVWRGGFAGAKAVCFGSGPE